MPEHCRDPVEGALDLEPPLVLYEEDGRQTTFAELDASYDGSFRRAGAAFVDGLLSGDPPDLDPIAAIEALQTMDTLRIDLDPKPWELFADQTADATATLAQYGVTVGDVASYITGTRQEQLA